MDKYAVTIDENNKIEEEIEKLLCNMENEWKYIISQTEYLTESCVFDEAKDMCYFVIKDGTLFYCGPVNVSRTELNGESAWRFDYIYFSHGKRKIHRDLSHIWSSVYEVFKDVEESDEIICVPTVLSCIDGEVQYIRKCKVYEANQIGDTYIVNWYREKNDAKKYEISIYKNSVLRKKIASVLYVKMSPIIGAILYSDVVYLELILDGGSIITYDYINNFEKEEVKKGRIQEKQELYGYHNYLKVDQQIYRYLPEGFCYTDDKKQSFDEDFYIFKQLLPEFGIIKELEAKDYYCHGEYCFIADINNCLKWLLEKKEHNEISKQNETYTFQIEGNFDKIYYCVSALSVDAEKIEKNGDVYELTFSGDNVETIELIPNIVYNDEEGQYQRVRNFRHWGNQAYVIEEEIIKKLKEKSYATTKESTLYRISRQFAIGSKEGVLRGLKELKTPSVLTSELGDLSVDDEFFIELNNLIIADSLEDIIYTVNSAIRYEMNKVRILKIENTSRCQSALFFLGEDNHVYMLTATPNRKFFISDEGKVGEKYNEGGELLQDKMVKKGRKG